VTREQFLETLDAKRDEFRADRRLEAQDRVILLAAQAHLETRNVERCVRGRSWKFSGLHEVERTVLREYVDYAITALMALAEEVEAIR
jgi:hypothetical protein